MNTNSHAAQSTEGQYLSFILNQEEYGVDIQKVMEIRGWEKPTPLPQVPKHLKGVMNLRGIIVPIIDLREKFQLPHVSYTATTVVIVIQVQHTGQTASGTTHKKKTLGLVVDAVSDVYNLQSEHIKPAPEKVAGHGEGCILGLAAVNQRMVILLDAEKLFDNDHEIDIQGALSELKQ